MKRKKCFVNGHCAYHCPNFVCDEIEETFDIPCSDAGYERISCRDCFYNSGLCEDCLFENTLDCYEKKWGETL